MADRYEYSEKIHTEMFRGSFANIFTARESKNQDGSTTAKFGITAMFMAGTNMSTMKQAAEQAAKKAWGDKAAAMLKNPKCRLPFKDGATMVDREGNLYAGFEAGQVIVPLSSSKRPGLVDPSARPIYDEEGLTRVQKDPELKEIIAENAAYSGCWFRATCQAQAYDRSDGFGISFKLENLQLVKQDDRLGGGGRVAAEDDFTPVPAAAGSASDLFK